jgi:hypothetical protein
VTEPETHASENSGVNTPILRENIRIALIAAHSDDAGAEGPV